MKGQILKILFCVICWKCHCHPSAIRGWTSLTISVLVECACLCLTPLRFKNAPGSLLTNQGISSLNSLGNPSLSLNHMHTHCIIAPPHRCNTSQRRRNEGEGDLRRRGCSFGGRGVIFSLQLSNITYGSLIGELKGKSILVFACLLRVSFGST